MTLFSLANRVAVVTGGTGVLGGTLVRGLAGGGARGAPRTASDAPRFATGVVTGFVVPVDGGLSAFGSVWMPTP